MVNGVIMITTVMGVLALCLGLFLVVNTINALVAQQIPQIGIMKAIGGTTRQVMTLYVASVLIYGLLALIIALPLGVVAADAVAEMLLKMMGISADPNVNASTSAVIQQVTVALLVPLLAALWPIYSGVRLTVREATSNYGIGATFGKGLIDRVLAKVRGLPRQAILTIRNTFRRKGRVVLTQITLIMAGVVFVMVMSSAASFTYTINYLTDSLGLKVLMYFEQPVRIDEAKAIIESQPDVEFAEFTLFQSSTAYLDETTDEGKDIFINAVLPDSRLLKLAVVDGRWLLPEDEHATVISTDTAGKMGVKVGDKIFVKIDGTDRVEWTVVGTVTDLSNMQRNIYVPLGTYQREVGLSGRGTTAWLSVTPDTSATQLRVEKNLREALNARGLKVGGTQTAESIRANNESTFGIITTMLLTMSALIAFVGAIGLAGTLSINVLERRREIGVMRAIGASSFQIARLFVGEGLILGLMAWVIAVGARAMPEPCSELRGMKEHEIHELVFAKGINLARTPVWQRRGVMIYRKEGKVVADWELPLFRSPDGQSSWRSSSPAFRPVQWDRRSIFSNPLHHPWTRGEQNRHLLPGDAVRSEAVVHHAIPIPPSLPGLARSLHTLPGERWTLPALLGQRSIGRMAISFASCESIFWPRAPALRAAQALKSYLGYPGGQIPGQDPSGSLQLAAQNCDLLFALPGLSLPAHLLQTAMKLSRSS